jgi:hypothetical protein
LKSEAAGAGVLDLEAARPSPQTIVAAANANVSKQVRCCSAGLPSVHQLLIWCSKVISKSNQITKTACCVQ